MDWQNSDVVCALEVHRGGTIATLEQLLQEVQRVTRASLTAKTLSFQVREIRKHSEGGRPPKQPLVNSSVAQVEVS
jgi:hypothetical protein